MKSLILFILFIALTRTAFTQEIFVVNKYCLKKDSALLFEDGNNIIQVYGPGIKGDDLKLKSMDHNLRIADAQAKGDTFTVWAMPYATGRKLRVEILNKKTNRLIKEVAFYADKLPEARAKLGSIKDSIANKKDLLSQSALSVIFPGSLYGYPYHILSYKFRTQYDGKTATLPVDGFWMTTAVLQQIKDVPAGTVIAFTEIKATCPECAIRTLPDLRIRVK